MSDGARAKMPKSNPNPTQGSGTDRQTGKTVTFKQINLQKSAMATSNLAAKVSDWSSSPLLVFLQEPATHKGRLVSFPAGCQTFAGSKPRAAILASSDLNVWAMESFTTSDITACHWKTNQTSVPDIILISVYMDITCSSVISYDLTKLMEYCEREKIPPLLCVDSNAHSTLWGCESNNVRGDILEEFISRYHLTIGNIGNISTFKTSRAESIIDITLVHSDLYESIKNWVVLSEDFFSDHRAIHFVLDMYQPPPKRVKNLKGTVWADFEVLLKNSGTKWCPPSRWNRKVLDEELLSLTAEINKALDKCTPTFVPKQRIKKNCWWNGSLAALRKKAQKSYRTWTVTGLDSDREQLLADRHEYRAEMARAKVNTWQDFCSEADDSKKLSRLNKILQRNRNSILGIVQDPNGVPANNPEDSINLLLDEHFPGSRPLNDDHSNVLEYVENGNLGNSWITVNKIRESMAIFQASKAAGPDGFKPIVLQHLPDIVLERVRHLFCASLATGYVPTQWRLSRVIFIPKIGKDNYAQVRAWRPISLMSFFFKTLERLILWEMEETVLKTKPMHKNQHAFRKGRSTESALSDTVDILESEVLREGFAAGVFLDIEGAFDNLLPEGVIETLRNRGMNTKLLTWFDRYLRSRRIIVDHKGVIVTRELVRGTPQGGVLSPILWNMAFDEVLELFDRDPIHVCGYADDLVLIGRGKDPNAIRDNLQRAIRKVTDWGHLRGLKFSATKSIAVMFTRRVKWECPPLSMNGKSMEWTKTVKYLGVTLDDKLYWGPHILEKVSKAKKKLFMYKQVAGKHFGPQPQYMRWLYTGIIRPSLCYGAAVWSRATLKPSTLKQLTRLSRLAMLTWGPIRRSTPTSGLEVIGYVPPIDLYLEGTVVSTWHRIKDIRKEKWDGVGVSANALGHRRALQKLAKEYVPGDYTWDAIPEIKKLERCYNLDIDSLKHGIPYGGTLECYTDGSKMNSRTGSGYCIIHRKVVIAAETISLGKYPTVFQAEIMAINAAAIKLLEYAHLGKIAIYCDSQAALLALNSSKVTAGTVLSTIMNLDALAQKQVVTLSWVKAHIGTQGNEMADKLAKAGANKEPAEREPVIPVPVAQIKRDIREAVERKWTARWTLKQEARQTKLFWPKADRNRTKAMLKLSRDDFGLMVQLYTGHNFFNRHRALLNEVNSATCRLCCEMEEDSEHILLHCPALSTLRLQEFGTHLLSTTECSGLPLKSILRFTLLTRARLEGLARANQL
jgi:ribonuclease HI